MANFSLYTGSSIDDYFYEESSIKRTSKYIDVDLYASVYKKMNFDLQSYTLNDSTGLF